MTPADIATRDAMLAILRRSTDPSAAWLIWSDVLEADANSLVSRCDRLNVAKMLREKLRGLRRVMMTDQAIRELGALNLDVTP